MTATWASLVGQDRAVEALRRAATRPGHAYLIAGPRGAGAADAARAFAAMLLAPQSDARTVSLIARHVHPDVIEYEPERSVITVDQARDEIIPEAWRSPIEADRKALILLEAERLQPEAANALLKTFEEPPERTVIILVSEAPDELLDTVRSRCQRIELGAIDESTIQRALVETGVDTSDAALAARLSGGQLGRARDLIGDSRALRDAFVDAASHLDGSGANAARAAEAMLDAVHEAIAAVKVRHLDELAAFDAEAARAGYEHRDLRRLRRRIEERHPARERLARRKAISEGITALESLYRDALAGPAAELRNLDHEPLVIDPRAGVRALEACRYARDALEFNPNEGLLLERLTLQLPASGRTPSG